MSYKKFKETVCSCQKCKDMCKTPCIGTPEEMLAISKAGFSKRLAVTSWATGLILGTHDRVVTILHHFLTKKKAFAPFIKTECASFIH